MSSVLLPVNTYSRKRLSIVFHSFPHHQHNLPRWLILSFFPDVTDGEGKPREKPILLLMWHMRKSEKCHRVQCGAGWCFPDVTDGEGKLRGRAISLLMWHFGKTSGEPAGSALREPVPPSAPRISQKVNSLTICNFRKFRYYKRVPVFLYVAINQRFTFFYLE